MACKLALGFGLAVAVAACEAPRGPDVSSGDHEPDGGLPLLPRNFPIVFSSNREGAYDLYAMSENGRTTRRITNGGNFWVPRWSPDGQIILCRQDAAGSAGVNAEVVLVSVQTGSPVPLTQGEHPKQSLIPANWSPDGTEVAYASLPATAGTDSTGRRLWKVPRSGGPPSRVFPDGEVPQRELAWSLPDGRYVAYTEGPVDAPELWLSDTFEGGPPTNISAGHVYNPIQLAWSPDGTRLAMSAYAIDAAGNLEGNHPFDSEIFVFDVTSGEFTRITDNAFSDYGPAWRPDGTALLVTSDRDGVDDMDLWLVPLDAPDEARNLIDDGDHGYADGLPHWFLGLP